MSSLSLFAACVPGLEPLLLREVAELGAIDPKITPGGVAFRGDLAVLYRANLELGLASHVVLRIAEFSAKHFAELVRKASHVPWEDYLHPERPFVVRATARRSKLLHTKALEERVRRAVGERFSAECIPLDGTVAPHPIVQVRMFEDRCTLSIDASGEPLHRRGYRKATGKAPLREDLARALVLASGWDGASPLLDPMMGSGTIPIEAAILARKIPPGLGRRFAFEDGPRFDPSLYAELRARALAGVRDSAAAPIYGSDRDAGAVRAATENAERAGVLSDLRLACAALSEAPFLREELGVIGALVTNPPHGRRIGTSAGLRSLHQRLGDLVRRLPPAYRVTIFSSDRRLVMATGLPLRSAALVDQGGTKARIFVRDEEVQASERREA